MLKLYGLGGWSFSPLPKLSVGLPAQCGGSFLFVSSRASATAAEARYQILAMKHSLRLQ